MNSHKGDLKRIAQRDKSAKRAYLFQNGFVVLVAILFLVVSLSFWADPTAITAAIGHVPPFDYYWNGFYLVGACLVLIGSLGRRVGVEASGHILLIPGLILNAIIAFMVLGVHTSALLCIVFALAAGFRATGLILGWRQVHDD